MNENPRGSDDADDTTRPADQPAVDGGPSSSDGTPGAPEARVEHPAPAGDPGTAAPDVTTGAPPLPGSAPRSLAEEQAAGGWQQPGAYQQPGSYQQPGAYQQPGSYQQPAAYPPADARQQQYQHPGSYQQPASYQQPGSYQQPASYQQPGSSHEAGAYPQGAPQQQTAAYPEAGAASQDGQATAPQWGAGAWSAPAPAPRKKRSGKGVLAATLAVGLLAGGALGGVVGGAVAGGGTSTVVGQSRDLTVNDYADATAITAVAAKATESVVTINVTAGGSGGTGSGVIVSDDGYLVTNTHVVTLDGASASGTISVTLSDGSILPAKVVGLDPTVDLAVLKVEATGLKPITFADSSKLNVGDTAVAIGAPLGLSNTVTDGIVSTLNRSITVQSSAAPTDGNDQGDQGDNNGQGPFSFNNGDGSTQNQASSVISLPVIQTDASINPGNSGGALLDAQGELIGLNVAIASSGESSGSIGVGFSVPSNLVERVSKEIIADGSASHGLLGASVDDAAKVSGADRVGAVILELSSGGAAEKAGLRKGDVVTEFNGVPVTSRTDLTAQVRFLAGGSTADLTYVRDGATATASVTLDTLDS